MAPHKIEQYMAVPYTIEVFRDTKENLTRSKGSNLIRTKSLSWTLTFCR